MSAVFDILEDERRRLLQLKERHENQISVLPKGSLSRKRRGNKEYCYLAYRDAGKVRFDYVGPSNSGKVKSLEDKIRQRRALEEKLRQIEENLNQVERGLRGRK